MILDYKLLPFCWVVKLGTLELVPGLGFLLQSKTRRASWLTAVLRVLGLRRRVCGFGVWRR